jgi:hypothetical protein
LQYGKYRETPENCYAAQERQRGHQLTEEQQHYAANSSFITDPVRNLAKQKLFIW